MFTIAKIGPERPGAASGGAWNAPGGAACCGIRYPADAESPTTLTMAKLEILEFPDPRLRLKAKTVDVFDASLKTLADAMLETMYAAPGIGLAATQVNDTRRLLVTDVTEGRDAPLVLVNPELLEATGTEVCQEGCLSFPGVYADVERKAEIKVRAQDVTGKTFELATGGLLAVCIQHEMDHLVGKVFTDHLSPLKRSLLLRKLEKQRRHAG